MAAEPSSKWSTVRREAMCAAAEVMHAQTTRAQREKRRLFMWNVGGPKVERSGASFPVDDPRWWVEDFYCHDLRVTLQVYGDLPADLVLRFTDGIVHTAELTHPFLFWDSGEDFRADLLAVLRAELDAEDFF